VWNKYKERSPKKDTVERAPGRRRREEDDSSYSQCHNVTLLHCGLNAPSILDIAVVPQAQRSTLVLTRDAFTALQSLTLVNTAP
jgi:hypothetical protein